MDSHPMREYQKTDMFPHNFYVKIKFQWRFQVFIVHSYSQSLLLSD